jgi:hypothetical protein
MPESSWYIRSRGRVFGPFTTVQLESMRERGQFTRIHEVSRDRQSWTSAASVPELFGRSDGGPSPSEGESYELVGSEAPTFEAQEGSYAANPSGPVDSSPTWFYARGGIHQGPVSYLDLRRMAAQGEIGPETLVWKSGMPSWVECNRFPDLTFSGPAMASAAAVPPPTQPYLAQGLPIYAGGPPRTSGLAVASLVLGILFLCGIGSLLATIFGAVAMGQISRSNGSVTGKGMAIAGFVLGIIGLGWIAFLFFTGMLEGMAESLQRRRFS